MSHALIKVRCTRCKIIFYRYNYGHGRTRQAKPRHKRGKTGGEGHGHPTLADTCILCRGAVEQL